MKNIQLHPYQQELKNNIYNDWNHGQQNVLAVLPTGGGKSIVVSDIVLDGMREGKNQAVIAHRNELVSQMSMHMADRGIYHRVVGSDSTVKQITKAHRTEYGQSFVNPSACTAVVGVDTLSARSAILSGWAGQVDRWVIDEAHHVLRQNKWGSAVKMFSRAHGLGVTATPSRADGQGLGREYDGVFDTMLLGPNMRELIDWGNLSEYEIVCPLSDLEMYEEDIGKSGDYSNVKLAAASERSGIVGDVVEAYCKYAFGKRAICFATDVKTATKIATQFNDFQIPAAAVSAKTPDAVREKYIREFKSGKILILINVDLFDEGFDVPACEVVIMARPTASLGKYLQMVGRCMRSAFGKIFGLIIDHVGNVVRHGLPDKLRHWTLARRDKRGKQEKDPEEIPLITCKSCSKPYERVFRACTWCGAEPPLPVERERSIEMVDGDLVLLDRNKLDQMRRATLLESVAEIGYRISDATGNPFAAKGVQTKQAEKIGAQRRLSDAIAQWAAIERQRGRSDSESYRRFYITMGLDVMSALSASNTRQQYEEMAKEVESWFNG